MKSPGTYSTIKKKKKKTSILIIRILEKWGKLKKFEVLGKNEKD